MKGNNLGKWIVGALVVTICIVVVTTLNVKESLVYFYTPAEAAAKAPELSEKQIRVGALVKPGSISWESKELELGFVATDNEGLEINVAFHGTPPDMFKENQGVVLEGRIASDGKSFKAKNLFVKHSEEYKKPDDHSTMHKALLEDSMFKD
ncbi:cytochrome c maturation protein CcmE [Oligoflexaceae bacterium]|nr:cytochrome c maturation protein CcmE [Oligoflexaceae bacterium]